MKKLLALALILMFILPPTLVSANRTRGVFLSGLRLDFDGVDEQGKTGNDPTGNTNTSGTMACWVQFDTTLSANAIDVVLGMGGDDTDQATNFGQFFMGRRYNTASSIDNKLEVFHRIDNSGTINRIRGGTTLSSGNLYLLVVSSSGTAWKLYVNGSAETLTTISGSNTGDWFGDIGTVGTRHYAISNSWRDGAWGAASINGKIDDCSTWSSQLSDAEVTRLYNGGKPVHPCALGLCTNLENLWKLGDEEGFGGTVTTMHDSIGSASVDNFTMENMESADIVRTSYY